MEKIQGNTGWFALVNPNAGNGKGEKDWARISDLFSRNEMKVEPFFTASKGHAIVLTHELISKGCRKIISVGGDGTLNEIINGIFTQEYCPPGDVIISMIPVGTGNDWGRMFGIPLVYEGAVSLIKEEKLMLHDIGTVTYYYGDQKEKRYFINIAGLGFESVVVKKTNRQKDKGKSSRAIYFYNLLSSLVTYRNAPVEIMIDEKKREARVFSINVGNGRYCGGGMRQTPDAIPDDGLLDITVIKDIGRIEIIKSLKLLYDGTILSHPKVDGYRSNNLSVKSDVPLWVEADGESLGHTPAEFGIIPSAAKIVFGTRLI